MIIYYLLVINDCLLIRGEMVTPNSSLIIYHSSFIIYHSSFITHHLSFAAFHAIEELNHLVKMRLVVHSVKAVVAVGNSNELMLCTGGGI